VNHRVRKLYFGASLLIGLQAGAHAVYVGGNPLMYVDPNGLKPGDTFPSRDAAAMDAGSYARTLNPQFVEYGGWIYGQGRGYSYNLGKGLPSSMPNKTMQTLKNQCPALPTDAWHTHPDPGDDSDALNSFSPEDKQFSKEQGVPLYLQTPMGPTLIYNPATGQTRKLP